MKRKIFILWILLIPSLSWGDISITAEEAAHQGTSITGEWNGARSFLRKKGIEFSPYLFLDYNANIHGGKKRGGVLEDLFDVNLKITSDPLFHYHGGTFYVDFGSHHGKELSPNYVGSIEFIDVLEAPPFDELLALWYKQTFANDRAWVLVGKSDAYDHFTRTTHAAYFINANFTAFPTIPLLPSYPNPAMSVIVSLIFPKYVTLTAGVYDGSLAEGVDTGKLGVFGHFFDNLPKHAFLIQELDIDWEWFTGYKGSFGFGWWEHTAKLDTFGNRKINGTSGPYLTLDQVIYKTSQIEGSFLLFYSSSNPHLFEVHRYIGTGLTWEGIIPNRPHDNIGIGFNWLNLTSDKHAEFTKSFEASYEIYYKLQFGAWHLEPDFQYVVHPGGKGLPNASVATLRLFLNF